MASRYWRYGTLYARTCDAIKLGILTPKQRPVWLEAYAMYPPLDNPVWNAEEDLVTDITESFWRENEFSKLSFSISVANFVRFHFFKLMKLSFPKFQPKKLDNLSIVYPEDEIRREYQEQHGNGGEIYNCIDLNSPKSKMATAADEARKISRENKGFLTNKQFQAVLQKNQPDYSRAKVAFIQALDKEHTGQPDPVGRLFGRQYGDELRGWPMY